jgi:DnaJ-class molecular chaperone
MAQACPECGGLGYLWHQRLIGDDEGEKKLCPRCKGKPTLKKAAQLPDKITALVRRYIGQKNTATVQAQMKEQIEALLTANIPVPEMVLEIDEEESLRTGSLVGKLMMRLADPPDDALLTLPDDMRLDDPEDEA